MNTNYDNAKLLLFHPIDTLYPRGFKLHKLKDSTFISIKAAEEIGTWSEKRFPGDDRDKSVSNVPRELYFRVDDGELLERFMSFSTSMEPILFIFTGDTPNTYKLIDFKIGSENKEFLNRKDLIRFPDNPQEKETMDWFRSLNDEGDLSKLL